MVASMWARLSSKGSSLEKELKSVTDSGVMDIPKELLDPVIEASQSEDSRQEIMKHLRECLAESTGKRWQRVYGGLVLAEELVRRGSPALLAETAEGHHFDLVQRLSLLEHFELTSDRRVQGMVRAKATSARAEVISKLEGAEAALQVMDKANKDSQSTCSPGMLSNYSGSTCTGSAFSVPAADAGKGRMVLNGIVSVGHSDDTTDESSADEGRAPVRFREAQKVTRKTRRQRASNGRSDSEDSDGSAPSAPTRKTSAQQANVQAPVACVDLLDL